MLLSKLRKFEEELASTTAQARYMSKARQKAFLQTRLVSLNNQWEKMWDVHRPRTLCLADTASGPPEKWIEDYLSVKRKHKAPDGAIIPARAEHSEAVILDAVKVGYRRQDIRRAARAIGVEMKHIPESKLWMWVLP